ncbi:MAG: site-2 protease family protein [Candidatus Spechtbacterales bacterium]
MKILVSVILLFGSIYLVASGNSLLLLFVLSLVIVMTVHEAGHAYFMLKHGIEIKEFGIGIGPIGKQLFYMNARQVHLPLLKINIPPVAFHPLLIGAYVVPTEEGEEHLKNLPLRSRVQIFGGGVHANLILAVAIYILLHAWMVILIINNGMTFPAEVARNAGISAILAFALLKWHKALSVWSPVAMGMFMAGLLWTLFSTPGATDALIGPIGIVTTGVNISSSGSPSAAFELAVYVFAISLSLGLFNSLPIPPLDGGHMATALMKRVKVPQKVISAYGIAGLGLFVAFVAFILWNDFQMLGALGTVLFMLCLALVSLVVIRSMRKRLIEKRSA